MKPYVLNEVGITPKETEEFKKKIDDLNDFLKEIYGRAGNIFEWQGIDIDSIKIKLNGEKIPLFLVTETPIMTDEEKKDREIFKRNKEANPNTVPCSMSVFALLTFEEWLSEYKAPLAGVRKQYPEIYDNMIRIAKDHCRVEGMTYVPYKEDNGSPYVFRFC